MTVKQLRSMAKRRNQQAPFPVPVLSIGSRMLPRTVGRSTCEGEREWPRSTRGPLPTAPRLWHHRVRCSMRCSSTELTCSRAAKEGSSRSFLNLGQRFKAVSADLRRGHFSIQSAARAAGRRNGDGQSTPKNNYSMSFEGFSARRGRGLSRGPRQEVRS